MTGEWDFLVGSFFLHSAPPVRGRNTMRRSISANANVAAVVAVIRLANASVVRGTRMDRLHEMYLDKHLKSGKPDTCDSTFSDEPGFPPCRVLGLPTTGSSQITNLQRQWQETQLLSTSRWVASSPLEHLIAG